MLLHARDTYVDRKDNNSAIIIIMPEWKKSEEFMSSCGSVFCPVLTCPSAKGWRGGGAGGNIFKPTKFTLRGVVFRYDLSGAPVFSISVATCYILVPTYPAVSDKQNKAQIFQVQSYLSGTVLKTYRYVRMYVSYRSKNRIYI